MNHPFKCTNCDYSNHNHSGFVDHLFSHQQTDMMQCPFCSYSSVKSGMELHMLKHKAVATFDCSLCEFSSYYPQSLENHMEVYHTILYQCEYCEKRLTRDSLIKHHANVHGAKEGDMSEISMGKNEPADIANKEIDYSRTQCSPSASALEETIYSTLCPDVLLKTGCIVENAPAHCGSTDINNFVERVDFSVSDFSTKYGPSVVEHNMENSHEKMDVSYGPAEVSTRHDLIQRSTNSRGLVLSVEKEGLKETPSGLEVTQIVNSGIENSKVEEMLTASCKVACSICDFSTLRPFHLDSHVQKYHTKKYSCRNCSAIMTKHALIEHYKNEHDIVVRGGGKGGGTLFKVATEGKARSSNNFTHAKGPHPSKVRPQLMPNAKICKENANSLPVRIDISGKTFSCTVCNFSCRAKKPALIHMERLHEKKFICKVCPAVMTKYDLMMHSKDVHGIEIPNFGRGQSFKAAQKVTDISASKEPESILAIESEMMAGAVNSIDAAGGNIFRCSLCDFSTKYENRLLSHIKRFHSKKFCCDFCPAVMTKYRALLKHAEEEHGVQFQKASSFKVCFDHPESNQNKHSDKALSDQSEFENITGGLKTRKDNCLVCSFCGYSSQFRGNLLNHLEAIHSKKFYCTHCLAVMTKFDLVKHLSDVHGVTKSIRGRGGLKEVGADMELERSTTTDLGEAVNYCSVNDEGGSSACQKISEQGTVARKDSSPPVSKLFQCSMCDFSTKVKLSLKCHMDSAHSKKYYCDHCSAIMTKYDLIKHYKVAHDLIINKYTKRLKAAKVDSSHEQGSDNRDAEDPIDSSPVMDESAISSSTVLDVGKELDSRPVDDESGPNVHNNMSERELTAKDGDMLVPNSFQCSVCKFSTRVKWSLTIHMDHFHSRKYHCNHCSVIMTKYDLIIHCNDVHGVIITNRSKDLRVAELSVDHQQGTNNCNTDGSMLDKSATVNSTDTEVNLTNGDKNLFCCTVCRFSTHVRQSLAHHSENLHKKRYCCDYCSVVLTKHDLIKHLKAEHGETFRAKRPRLEAFGSGSEDPIDSTNSDGDVSDEDSLGGSSWQNTSGLLKTGVQLHQFACSICEFSTNWKHRLSSHMERLHLIKSRCKYCPASLTKHAMIEHAKKAHGVVIKIGGSKKSYMPLKQPSSNDTECSDSHVSSHYARDHPHPAPPVEEGLIQFALKNFEKSSPLPRIPLKRLCLNELTDLTQ